MPVSTLFSSPLGIPIAATAVALASAAAGVFLTGARRNARLVVPFSGGLLLGIALFGLLPELSLAIGRSRGVALFAAGYLLLAGVDRFIYPVCPTCSHDHDHTGCTTALHGFAAPLVAATALHSFLDGWNVSAAQSGGMPDLRFTIPLAVLLHKLPEGAALGSLMLASVRSRSAALAWCAMAESVTIPGGMAALAVVPVLGSRWMGYPLALAGGCFLYLGFHAVHEEWKRRGAATAAVPAITGAAGAAVLQAGVHMLLG